MNGELEPGQKNDGDLQSGHAGHFLRNAGVYGAIIGVAAVGTLGYLWHESTQGSDQPQPSPAAAEESKLPGQSFEEILKGTQEVKRESPAVLANYDLARVIAGDYGTGETTLEQITVTAEGCRTAAGTVTPAQTISRVVFRNRGDESIGYKTAFLTPEHVEKTEGFRTKYRENRVESGKITRPVKPFTGTAENQIFAQLSGAMCAEDGTVVSLVSPEITQHALRIDDATYHNRKPYDDNTNPDWAEFQQAMLRLLIIGVIGGGGYLVAREIVRRRRSSTEP